MDKYTGAKTIGDGTYGSVLKAINKTNGMSLPKSLYLLLQVKSLPSSEWRRSTIDGTSASTRRKSSRWWNWVTQILFSYMKSTWKRMCCTLFSNTLTWTCTSLCVRGGSCFQSRWSGISCSRHFRVLPTCTSRIISTETWNLKTCFATIRR